MNSLIVLAAVAAASLGSAAAAQQAPAGATARIAALKARPGAVVLQELEWRDRTLSDGPSVAVLRDPPTLGRDGVTARVRLNCVVASESSVKDCAVAFAEPQGRGFEAMSAKISPLLRVRTGRPADSKVAFYLGYRGISEAAAEPHVVVDPAWAEVPSGELLARVYPARARAGRVAGQARFRCHLTAKGALVDCAIVSENPKDWGFAEAALKMTDAFRAWPPMIDGEPFGGATIEAPLVFKAP